MHLCYGPGMRSTVAALLAAVLAILALWQLDGATAGLEVRHEQLGGTPVTVYRPARAGPLPVVVIAHGFAGSQQLMQPLAVMLARNGLVSVTFDFPGHGRNATPLPGGLADYGGRTNALVATLDAVVGATRRSAYADGRVALAGHSMASDVVVRYAMAHPEVAATVALSLFFPGPTATSPRNLLVIDGALEPAMLRDAGLAVVSQTAGGQAAVGRTYGDPAAGTARRIALAPGVEHIGVLYSAEMQREALAWLRAAFGLPPADASAFVDRRGPWLALLYGALLLLAWPLAGLLPRVTEPPARGPRDWRRFLLVALVPAVVTPLALARVPTTFLPILLADYLVLHFALYGVLTALGLGWLHRRGPPLRLGRIDVPRFVLAVAAAGAYALLAVGVPTDLYATSLAPVGLRLPLIAALFAGTLAWCVGDELLTRSGFAPPGAYAISKFCYLLSLAGAIALDPPGLFFLAIIVPAILAVFVFYGLASRWIWRATGQPLVAAVVNALVLAWAITVVFPMVG